MKIRHREGQRAAVPNIKSGTATRHPCLRTFWGGTACSRPKYHRPQSCSSPRENIQSALIRPFVGHLDQSSAHRVFADIMPFFGIVFAPPQASVPEIALPCAGLRQMQTTEFSFPVGCPLLKCETQIARRTKKMKVIRHQNVFSHQPRVGLPPKGAESVLNMLLRQPRFTVLGANGQKNNRRLVQRNKNASGWMPSANGLFKRGHAWRIKNSAIKSRGFRRVGDGGTPSLPV